MIILFPIPRIQKPVNFTPPPPSSLIKLDFENKRVLKCLFLPRGEVWIRGLAGGGGGEGGLR